MSDATANDYWPVSQQVDAVSIIEHHAIAERLMSFRNEFGERLGTGGTNRNRYADIVKNGLMKAQ